MIALKEMERFSWVVVIRVVILVVSRLLAQEVVESMTMGEEVEERSEYPIGSVLSIHLHNKYVH